MFSVVSVIGTTLMISWVMFGRFVVVLSLAEFEYFLLFCKLLFLKLEPEETLFNTSTGLVGVFVSFSILFLVTF